MVLRQMLVVRTPGAPHGPRPPDILADHHGCRRSSRGGLCEQVHRDSDRNDRDKTGDDQRSIGTRHLIQETHKFYLQITRRKAK